MRSEQFEQWILLNESGELSRGDARVLAERLAHDVELAAFAHDADKIMHAARAALVVDGPSNDVILALKQCVAGVADLRPQPYARRVVKVLSYAAALVLALGLWRFQLDSQRADRIGEISAILGLASSGESTTSEFAERNDGELNAMAEMLLQLEGLGIEDVLGGSLLSGRLLLSRSSLPQLFDGVVLSGLCCKDMDDNIHVVQYHPSTSGVTGFAVGLHILLFELYLNFVEQGF